ncbi:MAG: YhdP family protein [Usitatibacter sp.]
MRGATLAAAFLVVAFGLLVLYLRYVALPHADDFRGNIVSSIEKASGMNVSVRSIKGRWDGLRPSLSLEGFAINDRAGKLALGFERADVTLSWWTLALGRLRFHDVDFYRPALALRRGADGLIYLGDKPLNRAGPDDGSFTEWLLAQPRVGIHDATLDWRDEKASSPDLRLSAVEIIVVRRRGRHHASLTAVPPAQLAGRIDLRANVKLTRDGALWHADGDAYGESRNADLAVLRAHLPLPETLRSGVGSVRVWAHFNRDGVREVVADLNVRDAKAQLAADVLPLELAAISGRATYRAEVDGFTFATERLRFQLATGLAAQVGDFSLSRRVEAGKPERVDVRADGIDLKIATTLLEYFPVPRDFKAQVVRFAPRGRIVEAKVAWAGGGASPARTYTVNGRFENLAINAVDPFPGVSGMTGSIEGTQDGGSVRIDSRNVGFELARFFKAPLAFDELQARAVWKHVGNSIEVDIGEAHFANADAEGRVAGTWRSLPDAKERSPGFVDLKGSFSRAASNRVAFYVPNRIAATRDWLERAIQAGTSSHVDFEVKGDLWGFPFGPEHPGHFLVAGDVSDGSLKYHPDWPSIDNIRGTFRFENRRMEIRAQQATIFASRATGVTAVIDDLAAKPPVLTLSGEVDTSGADTVRFLRESPLVKGPGAFTRAVAVEGPGRLKLELVYPMWGTEPVRVTGDYLFSGATATVAKSLAMREVRGRLAFTERGVHADGITGVLFGKPATLAMSTQPDGQVLTQIEGKLDAPAMAAYAPEAIVARLDGTADWQARVVSGKQGSELVVTSDLAGLESRLPEPLAKTAAEARPLTFTMARLGTEGEVSWLALAGGVNGRFSRSMVAGSERWNAALRFGSPVSGEPVREGLWLYGELPRADVDAWQAVSAAPRGEGPPPAPAPGAVELRGVDVKLGRARYLGREFAQVKAQLARSGSEWTGTLESPLVAGEIRWSWEGKGRLGAKLARLSIVEPTPAAGAPEAQRGDSDLPALDVSAERFEFKGKWLGRLDLKAQPDGDEWRIDKLDIVNGHARFLSTGGWRRTGAGSLTSLHVKLETDNLNALMAQFGYGDYLKRGSGTLEGALVWPGYPYEFSTSILAGAIKVEAQKGQFAKIEPGAGKLLGLLSLQSLPQRAMFDFRDVFSAGFAFDRIHGDVKVARGVLVTNGFEISGPAAFVSMSGEVSLPQETQSLVMHIVPEVGEGVALAATLIGTPVLGLSTLLVSKLLKNPLGKVVAYEYQVSGSWDNPQVTRLSAPPPKTAAATTPSQALPIPTAANPATAPARNP